jgi:RND family efflux transporter MFP subunit
VRTAKAELRMVQREIQTTGFLQSEHDVLVMSEVPGRVVEVLVDEGQTVERDQLMARIDDREARASVQQLRVQRQAAEVQKQLAELEAEAAARRIEQARIDRDQAQREFDRQSRLDPEIVVPKVLEDAKFAVEGAEEALQVAVFNERKSKLEVTRMENSMAELDARIEEANVRLEDHEIKAPVDGVVTRRHVTGGETITGATPLFEVIDPNALIAYLTQPQTQFAAVRDSKEVSYTVDAFPGREFVADVDLVSPVVDRETGHFEIRIRVRKQDTALLAHGMFIRARIRTEDLREALMVPKAAVLSEGDVSVVMVVREGKASRVTLDPGLELEKWVECRNRGDQGLLPDEEVIVSGHEDLKDQSLVETEQS